MPRILIAISLALPAAIGVVRGAEQGDQLTGQLAGQNASPLLHFGEHTFGVSFDPTVRVVFTAAGGRATKFVLMQHEMRFEAPRK